MEPSDGYKAYVEIEARFDAMGKLTPLAIIWEDGRRFIVDRVLDVRRAASTKAGGAGIRYTCKIHGQTRYLYLEESKWFLEKNG